MKRTLILAGNVEQARFWAHKGKMENWSAIVQAKQLYGVSKEGYVLVLAGEYWLHDHYDEIKIRLKELGLWPKELG